MNYNIFIVSSPLQLMNAIEATNYFKTNNNILLLLYTDNTKVVNQMKKIVHFVQWEKIISLLLPQKIIDKVTFTYDINNYFKNIDTSKIDKIFVGEYRSDHVNHIVNFFKNKNIYLLDDGLAQVSYHKEISNESFKVKIKRLIYSLLLYKLAKIKYTFFTIFDIKNEKVIKNRYGFFKKYIQDKEVGNSVYFIGQPLVELNIINEDDYKKELSKIINFYSNKKFIYILHRREDEKRTKKLSIELNFEYKVFDNLIELEMITSKIVPSDFATFYSTAIVTLPSFISEVEYRVFRTKNEMIHQKFVENISNTYKELKKMDLRIEQL